MELEKQQKLATTMTGEKERLEQRLDHLEKTLEDKANECVFLSEESQVKSLWRLSKLFSIEILCLVSTQFVNVPSRQSSALNVITLSAYHLNVELKLFWSKQPVQSLFVCVKFKICSKNNKFTSNFEQVKLTDAEEKIIKLTQDLDSLKSDLRSSSEKIGLEQKRFETVSGSLKDDLDKALEKVDQVS